MSNPWRINQHLLIQDVNSTVVKAKTWLSLAFSCETRLNLIAFMKQWLWVWFLLSIKPQVLLPSDCFTFSKLLKVLEGVPDCLAYFNLHSKVLITKCCLDDMVVSLYMISFVCTCEPVISRHTETHTETHIETQRNSAGETLSCSYRPSSHHIP